MADLHDCIWPAGVGSRVDGKDGRDDACGVLMQQPFGVDRWHRLSSSSPYRLLDC